MGALGYRISLTEPEKRELTTIIGKHTEKQSIVRRAKIILRADAGEKKQNIAKELCVENNVVTTWVKRWLNRAQEPVKDRLQDMPRPGTPDTFTPEQLCRIIALACENPQDYGRPITHWTQWELADEAVKQEIVKSISPHHLGRFLNSKDLQPHRIRYWLNGKPDEREKNKRHLRTLYKRAGNPRGDCA
jgi:transposase